MSDSEEILDELVWKWMDARAAGGDVRPENICARHLELLNEFLQRLGYLGAMNWLHEIPEDCDDDATGVPAVDEWPDDTDVQILGNYVLREKIGEGGMGQIFEPFTVE